MTAPRGGYWGKTLWVDLSSNKVCVKPLDEDVLRRFLGGVGLATKLISDSVTKSTNPLGPGNVIVLATGPFQATSIPSSGRCSIAAKSPLTGFWGESNGGGGLGPELKRAGFDAVAIVGRAKRPVFVWIKDGAAEIRDAQEYWGLDTVTVTSALREAVGDSKASVCSIGPAGENLVRYACIANDNHGFFGRCGLGAVMGSKNLKAVVVKGTLNPPVVDPDRLKSVLGPALEKVKTSSVTEELRTDGQAAAVAPREEKGLLPMKNWAQDTWPSASKISAPQFTEELKAKPWPCPFCIIGSHRRITNPDYSECKTGGPEYETLAMIGSNLLIEDLSALVKANELCNRYGIDTIEIGAVLGWAFECYEKGLLTKKDTDGVELEWGSGEALVAMVEKICIREGIGNLLAEGLRACVERIPESGAYAVELMGQAIAAHDPRAYFGQTVTTIASTRGGCHIHGWGAAIENEFYLPELGITEDSDRFDPTKKGYLGAIYQDMFQFWNSIGWCFIYYVAGISLTEQVEMLNAITGWNVTPTEAWKMGERIVCLQQMFNLAMGLVPEKDNVMPERFTIPRKNGGAAGKVVPWEAIRQEYWETKGWPQGVPEESKLQELGLERI